MHSKNEQYEACTRKYLVSLIKHVLNKYSSLLCESLFALNRMPSSEETFVFHLGFPLQHSPREISCRSCFKKRVKPDCEPARVGIPNQAFYPTDRYCFVFGLSEVLLHDPYKTLGRIPRPSTFLYGQDVLILSLKLKTPPTM